MSDPDPAAESRHAPAARAAAPDAGILLRRAAGVALLVAFAGALFYAQCSSESSSQHQPAPATTPSVAPAEVSPRPSASSEPAPRIVGAAHVLIAYKGALRAPANVTRSKEQAKKRAEEARVFIADGKGSFADAVDKYSDDAPTRPSHGDIGNFEHLAMPAPFSDTAFALQVGQTSGVVETPLGFHVIRRTR